MNPSNPSIISVGKMPSDSPPEWEKIAQAYEEAIVPFAPYQALVDKLVEKVGNRQKVLDLGCGTCYPLRRLLSDDGSRSVVGVDSSRAMLQIGLERLVAQHGGRDFRLYHADAARFREEGGFEAVVSSNVLFNLGQPMEYLDTAFLSLAPGGVLVISSPFGPVDMAAARERMEEQFRQEGCYEQKRQSIDTVWAINTTFPPERFNFYLPQRMKEILLECIGFDSILSEEVVYGKNFLLAAQKAPTARGVNFEITNSPERLRQGFRLRYHWLYDRYRMVDENVDGAYRDDEDVGNIGCFALEEGTGKVIGFLNYVPPNVDLPFADKELLAQVRKRYGAVGAFNGYYLLATQQQRGLGGFLAVSLMDWAAQQGVSALVTEANHEIVPLIQKWGWKAVGEPFPCTGGKKRTVTPMLCDLKESQTLAAIAGVKEKYAASYSTPSFTITIV